MEEIKKEGETPAENIAPGTESTEHAAQIEPHSPVPNALPNGGASGVSLGSLSTVSANEASVTELPLQMTSQAISVDDNTPLPKSQHPNDVKFKVKYKADFKGDKTLPEGSVQVISKESAEQFTKLGFGSVIK